MLLSAKSSDNCAKNIVFKLQKSEAVPKRCSSKKMICKYKLNLKENTNAEVLFQ